MWRRPRRGPLMAGLPRPIRSQFLVALRQSATNRGPEGLSSSSYHSYTYGANVAVSVGRPATAAHRI